MCSLCIIRYREGSVLNSSDGRVVQGVFLLTVTQGLERNRIIWVCPDTRSFSSAYVTRLFADI